VATPVDREQIAQTFALVRAPEAIVELRIPSAFSRTQSGYFDNADDFVRAAVAVNGHAAALYTTINEVDPVLLSRAKNRITRARETTGDRNIRRRRYMLVDCDAVRPAGISSTEAEHEAALAVARATRTWLIDVIGVPGDAIILADSGNGSHLLVRVDLPNDEGAQQLVQRCLEATAVYCNTAEVTIDLKVGNAARISKLYGTVAAKGDATADRPHRLARLLDVPATLVVTARAVLERWAATRPTPDPDESSRRARGRGDFDVRQWLGAHDQTISRERDWQRGATLLELKVCPFNAEHRRSARIIVEAGGRLSFGCFHDSCAGKRWADVRDQIEPGWRQTPACGGRRAATRRGAATGPGTAADIQLTDVGNAQRLVALSGGSLRYCAPWKSWLRWDGRRWARDDRHQVREDAKALTRAMLHTAADRADDDEQRDLTVHALRSQKVERLRAMLECAQSDPAIAVAPAQLDADPWVLNVLNGTIDLRTGQLREHRPQDLITKLAPVHYDWAARSDVWDRFLADAMGGDLDVIAFLQRCVGYSLTGNTGEEVLFFLHGPEATGKSTFLEACKAAVGDYGRTADFSTFLQRKGDRGIPNDIAALAGARLVGAIEMADGKQLAEGLVKQLTGGDTVSARFLFGEFFDFVPQFKLWLAANDAPRVRHADRAIWRRILRIRFTHTVPVERRDPAVKATLKDPAVGGPAILAWAVHGCVAWQRDRLNVPAAIREATSHYRETQDLLREFFDDCCVFAPDAWTPSQALYRRYCGWAEGNGIRKPFDHRAFGRQIGEHGCTPEKRQQVRGWLGIRLISEPDPAEDQPDRDEKEGFGTSRDMSRLDKSLRARAKAIYPAGHVPQCPDGGEIASEGTKCEDLTLGELVQRRADAAARGDQAACPKCGNTQWSTTLDPAWGQCRRCGPVRLIAPAPAPLDGSGARPGATNGAPRAADAAAILALAAQHCWPAHQLSTGRHVRGEDSWRWLAHVGSAAELAEARAWLEALSAEAAEPGEKGAS
jgi:putative DNA primase/helicase